MLACVPTPDQFANWTKACPSASGNTSYCTRCYGFFNQKKHFSDGCKAVVLLTGDAGSLPHLELMGNRVASKPCRPRMSRAPSFHGGLRKPIEISCPSALRDSVIPYPRDSPFPVLPENTGHCGLPVPATCVCFPGRSGSRPVGCPCSRVL